MNITTIPFVPLNLSQEAHYFAKKFAAEQATALNAKRVYLNTLAVCAVYSWVQWMEFTTEIDQGESWDPVIRRFNDVADLVLTDIGRLECRPLLPGERSIRVPLEVTEDRIGCVLVQFEEQLDKVKLLGFVRADDSGNLPEKISIEDLQSVEELTEYLEKLDAPIFRKKIQESLLVNLSQWFQGMIDEIWRTAQEVLGEERLVLARGTARGGASSDRIVRAQPIDLGMPPDAHSLALLVDVMKKSERERDIRLQVHPTGSQTYLPSGLKCAVLEPSGKIIEEVKAKKADLWVQFDIDGEPGEKFCVTIELGDVGATRNFVI